MSANDTADMADIGTYELMHADSIVCSMLYDPAIGSIFEILDVLDIAAVPPCAVTLDGQVDRAALMWWWAGRLVPASRFPRALSSRSAFAQLFEQTHGASLTDAYWLRKAGEDISRKDVSFFVNAFDENTGRELLGTMSLSSVRGLILSNPSSYTNGNLRKYWRITRDGTRQLVKSSSQGGREAINEAAVSKVCEILFESGEYVPYQLENIDGQYWSVCDAFTSEDIEYLPIANCFYDLTAEDAITGKELINRIVGFGEVNGAGDTRYLIDKMMILDIIIGNQDRHFGNFGFLRDVKTLRLISMAPLFDNGSSLYQTVEHPSQFAPFAPTVNQQVDLITDASWLNWQTLDRMQGVLETSLLSSGVDLATVHNIMDAVNWRIDMLGWNCNLGN